ncbi:MAG: hypothetical protein DRP74_06470 [Candidatus Omnitrophota bacterium]|nr:MAG: hypothetical protein DRP74_06470 [Candidatus Omnitrophota bacterium]
MEERRKFERLSVFADIIFKKKEPPQKDTASLTKNISKGGICFIAYEKLNPGELIDMTIFLPYEVPIRATGRVAWVNEFIVGNTEHKRYDVGIEFIEISDQDRELIGKHVFTKLHPDK